jgi:hypothetical protein
VSFISNNDVRFPDGLWAAGDIFLSLVDNIQESFGLTPIEAMAAGLPRVVSDWDGYRDGVTHGEDGFLIPTRQPPEGTGRELADLLLQGREIYGGFLGKTALSVTVDQEAAAEAIRILIEDREKRKTMAAKARARAESLYDWRHIIPAYENLWRELAAARQKNTTSSPAWPLVPDPFTMYAGYATKPLSLEDRVALAAPTDEIRALLQHEINLLALDLMVTPDDTMKLINLIAERGAMAIRDVFVEFQTAELSLQAALWRTLGWLLKLGILRVQ